MSLQPVAAGMQPAGQYGSGSQMGHKRPFDAECPVLHAWAKSDDVAFAPVAPNRPARSRMSGPYLLSDPDDPQGEKVPIDIDSSGGNVGGDVCNKARALLRQQFPDLPKEDLPTVGNKRQHEEIAAVETYCAALVQNADKIRRFPKFGAYMEEVCPTQTGEDHTMQDADPSAGSTA